MARQRPVSGNVALPEPPPELPVNPGDTPFATLTPERILDAVEGLGFVSNGRLLALNSYENRVYRVGLEDGSTLIAKFYRAARWTNEAILEEHAFAQELADAELPVVPPLRPATRCNSMQIYVMRCFPIARAGHRNSMIPTPCAGSGVFWGVFMRGAGWHALHTVPR